MEESPYEENGEFSFSPLKDSAEDTQLCIYEKLKIESGRLYSTPQEKMSIEFITTIHNNIFYSTFPKHSGKIRNRPIYHSKISSSPPEYIRDRLLNCCKNFEFRKNYNYNLEVEYDELEENIEEINRFISEVFCIHPFIDGNTRTTYLLRNYLLSHTDHAERIPYNLYKREDYVKAWEESLEGNQNYLNELILIEIAEIKKEKLNSDLDKFTY